MNIIPTQACSGNLIFERYIGLNWFSALSLHRPSSYLVMSEVITIARTHKHCHLYAFLNEERLCVPIGQGQRRFSSYVAKSALKRVI
jgi:hypothetical protein